jgi:hypothetical protein
MLVSAVLLGLVALVGIVLSRSRFGQRRGVRVCFVLLAAGLGSAVGVLLADGWLWWTGLAFDDSQGLGLRATGGIDFQLMDLGEGGALGALGLGLIAAGAVGGSGRDRAAIGYATDP